MATSNSSMTEASPNNGTYDDYSAEDGYYDIMSVVLFINKYYLWIILFIGLPGNFSTIITISRMRRLGSFTMYVVLLAVMDNLAIILKITVYQLLNNKNEVGTGGCRSLLFFATFFTSYANWILVMMAVERLVAVRYPLKIQKYLGYRRSVLWNITIGFILAAMYIPILWMAYYDEQSISCNVHTEPSELASYLHWTNISLFAFIPFICLALFNVLILRVIRQSFKLRNALRNVNSSSSPRRSTSTDNSTQRQIMLMLFTSTLVFVIFIFPACALTVSQTYWPVTVLTRGYAIKYLFSQVSYVLADSTHALNFYLYFLSARKFRRQFIRMWTCKHARPEQSTFALKFRSRFHRMSLFTSTTTRPTAL
ncbi:FMRFamide receptor-like [Physella acuta]|uniref:FMRFamide receptor-like n=1 Tax=Physella acuta TaxID=109671 RepID=UPI0027DB16CE|nr:FMRFamide receptor-like [Physella acuta]